MSGLILRPYQDQAVNDIRGSYVEGYKAPLLVLPTGGGKTVVFTHISAESSKRAKQIFILVHRIELLTQTSLALQKFDVRHGLINPNFTPDLRAPVQVASVQTLMNRIKKHEGWFDPNLIIIDEAHHAVAGTWRKILAEAPRARLLGVTATPCRGDGQGLGVASGGFFDKLILGPSTDNLIRQGFLVRPRVYAPKDRLDLSQVKILSSGDYDPFGLEELIDKPKITGDAVAQYQKICPGVPAVVFCVSVKHAEHVAAEFRLAGYRAYSVDGTTDDQTRRKILAGLGNGSVDIVASCDLISEGTDIPAIGCGIMLRPTESLGLYLQQAGRTLRPYAEKLFSIILDHVGNVLRHGMPDEEREWFLDMPRKKRKKNGEDEEKITVMQCDRCFAMHEPAPACPYCGLQYVKITTPKAEPEQVDGDLQEMTKDQIEAFKKLRKKEEREAKTLEDFQAIGQARGYKANWALHKYNAKVAARERWKGGGGKHNDNYFSTLTPPPK